MNDLRNLPSVESVLQRVGPSVLPRPLLVAGIRRVLVEFRKSRTIPEREVVLAQVRASLRKLEQSRLRPVINGTGIVLNTNLGRAPLSVAAVEELRRVGEGYCNLEMDLDTGERGGRGGYAELGLSVLCRAEAVAVVNNCAAALLLILKHFTRKDRKEVVISRGELVQIGGGFRIPEILEAAGACLREVGTTNKTTLDDYDSAITEATALILKVHRSNFYQGGFSDSPSAEGIAVIARKRRVVFAEDLGSGAMFDTAEWGGGEREPTPADVLRCGAELVCFSGDKLLAGPQCGIIAGRLRWVNRLKREPLFRALRCDKLVLSALQATVDATLQAGTGAPALPAWALLREPVDRLEARARRVLSQLEFGQSSVRVGPSLARAGGGTLPRTEVASVSLQIKPPSMTLEQFAATLRAGFPPVIGYVGGGWFHLDLRTVFPNQDEDLVRALREALRTSGESMTESRQVARSP